MKRPPSIPTSPPTSLMKAGPASSSPRCLRRRRERAKTPNTSAPARARGSASCNLTRRATPPWARRSPNWTGLTSSRARTTKATPSATAPSSRATCSASPAMMRAATTSSSQPTFPMAIPRFTILPTSVWTPTSKRYAPTRTACFWPCPSSTRRMATSPICTGPIPRWRKWSFLPKCRSRARATRTALSTARTTTPSTLP